MAVGRVTRFDDIRGYGFIASPDGGEDVFVHANDFGDQRHLARPGIRVEYEIEHGERGLKVASVRILDGAESESTPRQAPVQDDDGLCDVLSARQFATEITELLISKVPALTGGQITQIRQHLSDHARSHGWLDS